MKPLKALIVEDEINNAELLKHFVTKYCPEIELVGTCHNKEEAITAIPEFKPQLLFLDIVLEEDNAFDLLREIDSSNMHIIFITAFDEYALKAFRFNAADYLLKPLQIEELVEAVKRILQRQANKEFIQKNTLETMERNYKNHKVVTVSNIDKVSFLKSEEILYCKSSGRYTEFYLQDKRKLIASKSLGEYENELDKELFFRIHKSFIVNLNYITHINKKAGNYCELNNGSSLPISRRRMEGLLHFLKKM
jgi:two-component system LytT family response regulator